MIQKANPPDQTPQNDAVTPQHQAYRHVMDQDVAITMLMEIQRGLGEVRVELNGLRASTDAVKTTVDGLVAWKHKILGGAVVLGAICALLGYLITQFSPYVHFGERPAAPAHEAPSIDH